MMRLILNAMAVVALIAASVTASAAFAAMSAVNPAFSQNLDARPKKVVLLPPQELYETLFRRIVELQALPPKALAVLATDRGAVIAKQVAEGTGIDAARVAQEKPGVADGAQLTCKLALDVVKAAP